MKNILLVVILGIVTVVGVCVAADGPPAWAYGLTTAAAAAGPPREAPPAEPAPDYSDKRLLHLPGSTQAFTRVQLNEPWGPADWYPEDHPPMPNIVAHGRKPDARACSLCHYPNGKGRPQNAGITGLPVAYFIQQMVDFKNGTRKSAEPGRYQYVLDKWELVEDNMLPIAKGMTDDDIKSAAEYFGSMKWTPWIKVMESNTVPKTRIRNGQFLKLENGGEEPLGRRIIEMPENTEAATALRDSRSGSIAYVPIGSIKKGEMLVRSRQCGMCHGADLRGVGPVPGLAGRSASYLVRQLYNMQKGTRKGEWIGLMKTAVANLSEDDMLEIAAYTTSLMP